MEARRLGNSNSVTIPWISRRKRPIFRNSATQNRVTPFGMNKETHKLKRENWIHSPKSSPAWEYLCAKSYSLPTIYRFHRSFLYLKTAEIPGSDLTLFETLVIMSDAPPLAKSRSNSKIEKGKRLASGYRIRVSYLSRFWNRLGGFSTTSPWPKDVGTTQTQVFTLSNSKENISALIKLFDKITELCIFLSSGNSCPSFSRKEKPHKLDEY